MGETETGPASDQIVTELEGRAKSAIKRVDLPLTSIAVSLTDVFAILERLRRSEGDLTRVRHAIEIELSAWKKDDDIEKKIGELSMRELRIATRLLGELSENIRRIVAQDTTVAVATLPNEPLQVRLDPLQSELPDA